MRVIGCLVVWMCVAWVGVAASCARVVADSSIGYYSVSDDGRYLLNMRALDRVGRYALELHDTLTGGVRRIPSRGTGTGFISGDGRTVIYTQFRARAHPFEQILRAYSVTTGRSRTVDSSGRLNLLGLDPTGRFAAVEKFPTHVHRNIGTLNLKTRRFRRFPLPPSGYHNIGLVALATGGKQAVTAINSKFGGENVLVRQGIHRDLEVGLRGTESPGDISTDGSVSMVNLQDGGIALIAPDLTRLAVLPNAYSDIPGFAQGSITNDGQIALQDCGGTLALYSLTTHRYSRIDGIPGGDVRISGSGNRAFVVAGTFPSLEIDMYDTATATEVGPDPPTDCVPTPPRR